MTNMWLHIPINQLCDQHLLGLHNELHKEAGSIKNHPYGEAITAGHWKLGQVSTDQILRRHRETVLEMQRRNMNHDSPLKFNDYLGLHEWMIGAPFKKIQKISLANRCEHCNV